MLAELISQVGATLECLKFFWIFDYCGLSSLDFERVSLLNTLALVSDISVYVAIGIAIFFGLRMAGKAKKINRWP